MDRTKVRTLMSLILLTVCVSAAGQEPASAPARQLVAAAGEGYLELVDGYRVLHLKGTPEQMGRQHGLLLRDQVRENCLYLGSSAQDNQIQLGGVSIPRQAILRLLVAQFGQRLPAEYVAEMHALADAAGLERDLVVACNLIPEMFHCSGFALLSRATADGELLHGRLLDYAVDMRLQEHAVLIIQEPSGTIPFVNVSYAGFIGSVTGMNLRGVSIGEMGGGGQGKWGGLPMALLVRRVLERAASLDDALAIMREGPRTCEYYYVIADAGADSAAGLRATPESLEVVGPGQSHPQLSTPVPDTVILSAGKRYPLLAGRIRDGYGTFTQQSAIRLMDAPVAMGHNLHDVLMVPGKGVLYVANAAADGAPAWQQKYFRFDVRELMACRPAGDAPQIATAGDAPQSTTGPAQQATVPPTQP